MTGTKKRFNIAFMGPLGGANLTAGDEMTAYVQTWVIPGYDTLAKFFPWENWQQAGDWLAPADVRAAIGYSNGGNTAAWLAAYGNNGYRTPTPLDLLVGLDPTIWLDSPPLPPTVKRAHYFWNGNFIPWFTQFVGHGRYTLAEGNRTTKLTSETIYDFHGNVDKNPARQQAIYKMLRALAV